MSTPESWNVIKLEIEVIRHRNYRELGCILTSPERRDAAAATPTRALEDAAEELVRLHEEFGQVMSKVICIATKEGESWRMKSTME